MNDGAIVFSTELDNKKLEKQLEKTKRDIVKLEQTISRREGDKAPLEQRWKELEDGIRSAREEAEKYHSEWASGMVVGADQKEMAALQRVKELSQEQAKAAASIDKIDKKLLPIQNELDGMKKEAGELEQKLARAAAEAPRMGPALKQAEEYMERFTNRVKGLAKRVLIFSVITAALRSMRTWMSKVIRTNEEASAAMARLRGALLTLVQPLVGVIIPAFTVLVNLLAKVASAVAFAFSALFGKTVGQSKDAAKALNKETQALEGVGAAADKAQNNLAGFDDLDVLATDEAAGGGGGVTAEIPSFDLDLSDAESNLDRILNLVKLIGPALLSWKLASGLKDGLVKFIGLFMAFDGAINLVKTTWDAWQNGVDWGNLLGMLGRSAELVAGLYIALGPTAAAVGLIVSGLTMLATAFHDAGKSGWNLKNTLLAIAGVLGTGLGIAVLTGSWIPLLLAGIGAVLLAITTAFGGGEELLEGAKTMLQGFLDFFCGIFAGDMERTVLGIQEIFGGLKTVFDGVIGSVENMFLSFLTWLDQKTKGKFHGIIEYVKSLVTGSCKLATQAVGDTVAAIRDIFIGLIHFITGVFTGDWDLAWQGVGEIFKGAWNGIVGLLETACNLVIDGINWTIQKIVDGLNSLIESINDISSKVGISGISTIHAYQFDRVEIPRLAQGAVIPPNREFLAVLGDQKSGTNIEAPLETMVEAFRMALEEQQGRGGDIVLKVDGRTLARVTGPYFQAEQRRKGVKLVLGGV